METLPDRLVLEGVTKRYGGVLANDAVDLRVAPGSIHALLGENGAGKSTLMKIAGGVEQADAGCIRLDGERVRLRNPRDAGVRGVAMVFQHFALFDSLSVAQNILLGQARGVTLAAIERRVAALGAKYGLKIDPRRPVATLSVGERQRVELLRALFTDPRLLILDEPTAVLAPGAIAPLFDVLRGLAAAGCSILYASHKLDEVRALCDACSVLRGGRVVARVDPRAQSEDALARLMLGTVPTPPGRRAHAPGASALRLRDLSQSAREPHGTHLHALSLDVRAGEIVGIAGVAGNGQRELLEVISGEDARAPAQGCLELCGAALGPGRVAERRAAGLRVVPEERLGRASVPRMSLVDNALLTRQDAGFARLGWVRRNALRALASRLVSRFDVRTPGVDAVAAALSGGNLQKYVVGREIDAGPKVLVVAQPTWGVDVGAAAGIHAEILALRDAGCAVLVISQDLDEIFGLSDRIGVIARGRLSPLVPAGEMSAERIGRWMGGLWNDAPLRDPDSAVPTAEADRAAA